MTKYHGKDSPATNYFRYGVIALFALILLAGGYFLFQGSPTGHAVLDVEGTYAYGDQLNGTLRLSLKPGELLPYDTEVVIRNGNQIQSLPLADLILVNQTNGTFYIEGVTFAGEGSGFGTIGTRTVYPAVDFQLLISKEKKNEENDSEDDSDTETETPAEEEINESENETTEGESNQTGSDSGSDTQDPETETPDSTQNPETQAPEESSSESTPGNSENSNGNAGNDDKTEKAEKQEEKADKEDKKEDSGSLITGNVVSEDDSDNKNLKGDVINGRAVKGIEFIQTLEDDQTASLVEGSVISNGIVLDDAVVEVDVNRNEVVVKTEYFIEEQGFGEEYLQDEEGLSFAINLTQFGIIVEDPTVIVGIYRGQTTLLEITEELYGLPENESEQNQTEIPEPTETNDTFYQMLDLPTLRLIPNSSVELNLSEYFFGAERYEFNATEVSLNLQGEILNITPNQEFAGATQVTVYAFAGIETLEGKITLLVSSGAVNIQTLRGKIVVGELVQWTKNITLAEPENITIILPAGTANISVVKVEKEDRKEVIAEMRSITGNVIHGRFTAELDVGDQPAFVKFFKKLFATITGRVIDGPEEARLNFTNESTEITLADNATNYLVTYLTMGPQKNETLTSEGQIVTVTGPEELNYTDVVAFTNISFPVSTGQLEDLKLYWRNYDYPKEIEIKEVSEVENTTLVENNILENVSEAVELGIMDVEIKIENLSDYKLQEIPIDAYDLDFNGELDYVEWVVPHLSSQTFILVLSAQNTSLKNVTFTGNYSRLAISPTEPYNDLAHYWSFDADNTTVSYDLSRGLNASFINGASVNQTICSYGRCLALDGNNDYIYTPYNSLIDYEGKNYTWTAWINPTASETDGHIFSRAFNGNGEYNYRYYFSSNTFVAQISGNSAASAQTPASSVPNSAWTFVAVTLTNKTAAGTGNISIYLNGVISATSTHSINNWTPNSGDVSNGMQIGTLYPYGEGWGGNAGFTFNGTIDEAMIFNTTLTAQQILDIYRNQSARFVSQGIIDGLQYNISKQSDLSINLTVDDYKRDAGSNISARVGRWDVSQGYNDSDSSVVAYYHFDQNYSDSSGNGLHLSASAGGSPSMSTNTYTTTTETTYTVPAGVTTLMIKAWGAGGGGGVSTGGASGGGGGFVQGNFSVVAGDVVYIIAGTGAAGGGGTATATYARIRNSGGTTKAWAVPGSGGNAGTFQGEQGCTTAGAGGAGGGTSGSNGGNSDGAGGSGASSTSGGAGGSGNSGNDGTAGGGPFHVTLNNGGAGGTGSSDGGAGGSGYYGGGGGEAGHNDDSDGCDGGGGGGGGSGNLTNATSITNTAGSGATVANSGDADYSAGKGNGGSPGNTGQNGYVVIKAYSPGSGTAPLNDSGTYNGSIKISDTATLTSSQSTAFSALNATNFTVCVWVKDLAANNNDRIIVASSNTTTFGLFSSANTQGAANRFTFQVAKGSGISISDTVAHVANQWYYVCGVNDIATPRIQLYVDGQLKSSTSSFSGGLDRLSNISVGVWSGSYATAYLNGSVDELLIVNRTLSDSEIKDLYVRGRAKWDYTQYKNLTVFNSTRAVTTFEIKNTTTNIAPSFLLSALNYFYTPFMPAVQPTSSSFSVNDLVPPMVNLTAPTPTNFTYSNSRTAFINISVSDANAHHTFSSLDDDLALWLRFDSVNATGHPADNSTYNSTVTAVGGAVFDTNGKFGGAFRVFGNGSIVRAQDNMGLRKNLVRYGHNTTTPYGVTLAMWIKYNGTQNAWVDALSRDARGDGYWADPYGSYRISATDGSRSSIPYFCAAIMGVGNACVTQGSNAIANDTWTHVVGMYNGTHEALFINGTRVAISAQTGPLYSDYLPFQDIAVGGSSPYIAASYFNGSIDEVMIFNRGLKESEISALYNSQTTPFQTNVTVFSGRHTVTGYAFDDSANFGKTETRTFYTDALLQSNSLVNPTFSNVTTAVTFHSNTTIVDENLQAIVININGTNTTIYNESTTLLLNFDNRSALNEAQNVIVDLSIYNHPLDNYDEGPNAYNGFYMFNASGKVNGAYMLNNSCNAVILRNDLYQVIPNNGSFSISLWLKATPLPSAPSGSGGLVTQDLNNQGDYLVKGYRYSIVDGNHLFMWSTQNNGSLALYDPNGLQNDTWYHVITSYNPNPNIGSAMYVNGRQVVTSSGYIVPSTSIIGVGAPFAGGGCLNGLIDEVMIMNFSLSATQARVLYDTSLTKLNGTVWNLYSNFSNVTGTNTYTTLSKDSLDAWNTTARTITSVPGTFAFVSPTPNNGSQSSNANNIINISITETHLSSLIWNWNGTNSTIYNESLVLFYNFDNRSALGENGTYIVDHSIYSNNASTTSAFANNSGRLGGAYTFDGINDGMDVSSENRLALENITISMWVNSNKNNQGQFLLAKEASSVGSGWRVTLGTTCINCFGWVYGGVGTTSTTVPTDGRWYHLVVMRNSSNMAVYVNGVREQLGANGAAPNFASTVTGVGYHRASPGSYFNGSIDQIMIYNGTLSDAQIKQIYDSNLYRFNSTQWYLTVNESNLSNGPQTYSAQMKDSLGTIYNTGQRTLTVNTFLPQAFFVAPTQPNRTIINRTAGYLINATIVSNNLDSLTLGWNTTSLTFFNSSMLYLFNMNNLSVFGENATYALDHTVNAGTTTAYQGAIATSSGRYSGGFALDGVNDYLRTDQGYSDLGTTNQNYSFAGWFKFNTSETSGNIVFMSANSGGGGWCLPPVTLASSKLQATSWNGGQVLATGATTLSANTWYHFVNTWDPTNGLRIYLNGNLDGSTAQSTYSASGSSNYIFFGSSTGGCSGDQGFFNGTVDEMFAWKRSLTADEARHVYESNLHRFNETQWGFQTNRSNITQGEYYYYLNLSTVAGNINTTDIRTVGANWLTTYECRTFNISGMYFQGRDLINGDVVNMSGNSLCYEFTAPDVSLDCLGHSVVNRSNTEFAKSMFYLSGNSGVLRNTTVQNCNITGNPSSGVTNYAITATGSPNIIMLRGLNLSGGHNGIILSNGAGNVTIANSTFANNSNAGIIIQNSAHNVTVINNLFRTNEAWGIVSQSSTQAISIMHNNFTNSSDIFGAYITLAANSGGGNYIFNNSFTQSIGYGMEVGTSNTTILGNHINTSGSLAQYGIRITEGTNISVINNTVRGGGTQGGIYIANLNNSQIVNNSVFGVTQHGYYITNAKNITVVNNSAISNTIAGFYVESTVNSTFENNTAIGNRNGLYLNSNVNYSKFNFIILNTSSQDALVIAAATIDDNNFTSLTIRGTNAGYRDLRVLAAGSDNNYFIDTLIGNYSIDGAGSKLFFKEGTLGEIRFTSPISGSGINLSSDISIKTFTYSAAPNRVAYVNGSNSGLNKSANVTFYGMPGTFGRPIILKDGRSDCGRPNCVNLTSLNAATVIFNVTGWSNYTIANDTFFPEISIVHPTNVTYNRSTLDLNYTFYESNPGSCFYSQNAGANSSPVTCGINFTGLTATQGSNIWRVYVNDTGGNVNSTAVTFFVDSLAPNISYVWPTPTFTGFTPNSLYINITSNDSNQHYVLNDFDKDLNLWMRMDDINTTNNGVVDLGNWSNNNATIINQSAQNNTGKFGKALSFDGVDDSLLLNTAITPGNLNWTVSTWVNTASAASTLTILSHNSGGPVTSLFGVGSGKMIYQNYNGTWDNHAGSATVNDGRWHLLTWVNYVNQTMLMYVDGVLDSGPFNSFTTNGGPVNSIGRNWGSSFFSGSLDEFIIINRSLNPTEIGALYNASTTRYQRNFTSLTQGVHTFAGYAVDILGNKVQTAQHRATIDTVTPNINFTNPTPQTNTIQTLNNFTVNVSTNDTNWIYSFNNLDKSLVGWWRMETNLSMGDNETVVYDHSGNGHNGSGFNVKMNETGAFGGSYSFKGIGNPGTLNFSNSSAFTPPQITVSAWIVTPVSTISSEQMIISKFNGTDNSDDLGWYMELYQTRITVAVNNNNWHQGSHAGVGTGTWNHVAFTYNGSNLTIYYDGAPDGSFTDLNGISATPQNLTIGAFHAYGINLPFNGSIDEVMIFNRSLSPVEMALLFNATAQNFLVNYTNLSTGNHSIRAHVVDIAGNMNSTEERIIRVNTPPSLTNVSLNSTFGTNKTGENLTVFFNHSDADGDRLTNITDWRINGTGLYSIFNAPFNTNISGVGSALVRDYSLREQNGTLGGGTASLAPAWNASGKVGGAYSFDGVDDYISLPADALPLPMMKFSITGWFMTKGASDCLIWESEMQLCPSGAGSLSARFYTGNTTTQVVSGSYNNDVWTHVAWTYDGNTTMLYINGTLVSTNIEPTGPATGHAGSTGGTNIGTDEVATGNFNGTADEIQFFNVSLSASQVAEMYRAGINNLSVQRIVSSELVDGQNWTVAVTANDAWSDGNTMLSNSVLVGSSSVTNCTGSCFYVRNATGFNKTIFDKLGNVDIKGALTQSSVGTPDGRDLIFRNSAGSTVAWVDDSTGNMRLAGTLSQYQSAAGCTPPTSSFVIRNESGQCVSYIDNAGNLWLKGGFTQNALI